MKKVPGRAKRHRATIHVSGGSGRKSGPTDIYTWNTVTTRRGKTAYEEVPALGYYRASSSEEEDTPTRKKPKTPGGATGMSRLEDECGLLSVEDCYGEHQFICAPRRTTKVSTLSHSTIHFSYSIKTQNDFLLEWIPWRARYLSVILESENAAVPEKCQVCFQADGNIRCLSCLSYHTWCGPCAVKCHVHHPFHRVQQWTGQFYNDISLCDLGYILNLGHNGESCPNNKEGSQGDWSCDQFTIVHSTGIFVHQVKWCRCNNARLEDRHLQLLRSGIFPSTIVKPQTGFTFEVLDHFLIDAVRGMASSRVQGDRDVDKRVCIFVGRRD